MDSGARGEGDGLVWKESPPQDVIFVDEEEEGGAGLAC